MVIMEDDQGLFASYQEKSKDEGLDASRSIIACHELGASEDRASSDVILSMKDNMALPNLGLRRPRL